MDIVDTFNHLIPSDQLDNALLLGQNLESEASDELGTDKNYLEDSLKNMLSDKDPMLGSASTQFHLLDNDDANYPIAGSTGLEVMSESQSVHHSVGCQLTRPKSGRGRGKAVSHLSRKSPRITAQEPVKSACESSKARRGRPASKLACSKATGKPGRRAANKPTQHESVGGQEEQGDLSQERKDAVLESVLSNKHVAQSMNPVVVLRRLTVTVGGYKIELLPGPSQSSPGADATVAEPLCFQESSACAGGLEFAGTQAEATHPQDTAAEVAGDSSTGQDLIPLCAGDTPAQIGPYGNPTEVQDGNSMLLSDVSAVGQSTVEAKPNDHMDAQKVNPGGLGGSSGNPNRGEMVRQTSTDRLNTPKGKGGKDQRVPAKTWPKSDPTPSVSQQQQPTLSRPASTGTGPKPLGPRKRARSESQNVLPVKGKQMVKVAKRRTEHLKTHPPSKIQKCPDRGLVKGVLPPYKALKSAELAGTSGKRPLPPSASPDVFHSLHQRMQPAIQKSPHTSTVGPRPHHQATVPLKPGHQQKEAPEEEKQEKLKIKKLDKASQRPRSRSSRSLSLDEPQLFIPDNAPVAKKEAVEEESADSEAAWDPSKHCGFCKKPHTNRLMVGCGRCDDWFHGDCVGLDLAKAQQMEQEDQEYVCLKCCAEEDKKGVSPSEGTSKPAHTPDSKPVHGQDKQGAPPQATTGVRIIKKDSVERRQSTEVRDTDSRTTSLSDQKNAPTAKAPHAPGDSPQKTAVHERQDTKKSKASPPASKKPSVEQIRRNVRDSLKDILLKRLKESDLKVSTERAANVAIKIEKEIFAFFRDTDSKYKSKYRSLMFNLKDAKNNVLFKRVLKGEISPDHLIRMSPEELASKELAAWRQRENRHMIEMIEKEQREAERRPITKITHKGEIEIESEEPIKQPEAIEAEVETVHRPAEEAKEVPEESESESSKDTTSQHKTHLFDLNCKICTGRMAPPAEDGTTKVVKVATTVLRRQSGQEAEARTEPTPPLTDEFSLSTVEECLATPRVLPTSDGSATGRQEEVTFLARLESLWRGFVNMPSVAKFVTKAYPVSGVLDHLTEDLPDSIQVGGRISPQTVWDYVEKIRASGTKEVCLIRFSPATEEDEISYTLLYAYFSSRKRYGVVANNMKHVKDMYLIPLGCAEKIPHQLVPFDGPGLETNRPNILLGLIIRQRVKRDYGVILPISIPETSAPRLLSENRAKLDPVNNGEGGHTEASGSFDPLNIARLVEVSKPQQLVQEEAKPGKRDTEGTPSAVESSLQEPAKPLRFLPGVLVGGEGSSASSSDTGEVLPSSTEKEADKQAVMGDNAAQGNVPSKSPASNGPRLDRFIIKKKEPRAVKTEALPSSPKEKSNTNDSPGKDGLSSVSVSASVVSLKDKPSDVSTEAFLASLAPAPAAKELGDSHTCSTSKAGLMGEETKPKLELPFDSTPEAACDVTSKESISSNLPSPTKGPRPPAGGILKNSSPTVKQEKQSSSVDSSCGNAEEKGTEMVNSGPAAHPTPHEPSQVFNVPVLNTDKQCLPRPAATTHEYSCPPQTDYPPMEDIQSISTVSSYGKNEEHNLSRPGTLTPTTAFSQGGHRPLGATFPPVHVGSSEFPHHAQPPGFPMQSSTVPPFQPLQQPRPPSLGYSSGPPFIFPQPEPHVQNHALTWSASAPPPDNFPPPGPTPQANFPPPGPTPQASFPPPGPAPQASFPPPGPAPQASFPLPGPTPQASFPPPGPTPQASFAPPGPTPQANFPPPGPTPQVNFPPSGPSAPVNFPPPGPSPPGNFPPPGPAVSYEASRFTEVSKPPAPTKDEKGPELRYSDPWEKQPRHSEDSSKRESGDHYSRQRHHSESYQERKARHHERERDRGKHRERHRERSRTCSWSRSRSRSHSRSRSRSHSRSRSRSRERSSRERRHSQEDKHRDSRSRHHSYSDHHSRDEKRKDRRHSDKHSSHHKDRDRDRDRERDRDRHRRPSDYDKGRKSLKEKSKERRS
ncbi:hypothetical protein MATL_G00188510 [Megalops atlanticus]|uniref:PHD finger protein 3 n=1 Tax=Megalops atlanticus TaxID=7932 RepID=A0A9D3T1K8_MEGAT|nr:hypothetical protein MATL_G00188510 [Megalops atlanticus]